MNKHDPVRTAKVFWSGRSQAVRLPKDFRFDADEVTIRKVGDRVILEPKAADEEKDPWAYLHDLGPFSDDVVAAANEEVDWTPEDPEYWITRR